MARQNNASNDIVTTLHGAVRLMDLARVKELVDAGADVNEMNVEGQTPLHLFDYKCDSTVQIEMLRFFLEHGASVNIYDPHNLYSFSTVAPNIVSNGNTDLVKLLIESGFDLSTKDDHNDMTFLHYAAGNKNPGVIELFEGIDIDMNARDASLLTPLGHAIQCANVRAVEFLLKNGVDAKSPCVSQWTPLLSGFLLHFNKKDNWDFVMKCTQILLSYGVDCEIPSDRVYTSTLFDLIHLYDAFVLAEPLLGHLAMREALGVPPKKISLSTINHHQTFKGYFDFCRHMIKEMKRTVVYNKITLFTFLEENDKPLALYARNRECLARLERVLYSKRNSDLYIMKALRKRIANVLEAAKLREETTAKIANLTGLSRKWDGIDIIISYLSNQDLKNVCKL